MNRSLSGLKIGFPVGGYHIGNTSDYLISAAQRLGAYADILSPAEFYSALKEPTYDFFLCVDSGETIDLNASSIAELPLKKVGFWFIDFRHNKTRQTRIPTDLETAKELNTRGGVIFQAQLEDQEDCLKFGLHNSVWLPLAADPDVWRDSKSSKARYDLGFVGHVWDKGRQKILETLINSPGLRFAYPTHEIWRENAADFLTQCKAGFNVNSFYGEPYSYDLNMRVFETLSCGLPIITNNIPSLSRVFPNSPYIRTYNSSEDLLPTIYKALNDAAFLTSGNEAREEILKNHTYELRLQMAIDCLSRDRITKREDQRISL